MDEGGRKQATHQETLTPGVKFYTVVLATKTREKGRGLDNYSGYVVNPGLDFWEVVARHEGGRGV